jgi:WD40 repeat protein
VCNLVHSKTSDEVVGCFGYPLNEISVWDSQLNKIATLTNNKKGRVLYAAIDHSGDKLITGNGVGDIDFWRPFDSTPTDILSSIDCR